MTRSLGRYALVTVVTVGVVGFLFTLVLHGPGDAKAIWISAAVAVVIQMASSALGQMVGGGANVMARMGIGALMRFLSLAVYAVLVVMVLHLPHVAALISFVCFLFLCSILEPLLNRS
ncbi:MAG: hypothetical protein ABI442_19960 [Gemmatimonadaceae bacterium]